MLKSGTQARIWWGDLDQRGNISEFITVIAAIPLLSVGKTDGNI